MHRDLKLANILVNNESCKLADLGFAKKMNETQITYTMVGTQITMAPEVLE
jgi:serine/threonine protein kinase